MKKRFNLQNISTCKLVGLWQLREWHKTPPQSPPVPLYFKSKPQTPKMEDTLWDEIQDAPGEIFDIPEDFDRNKFFPFDEDADQSFQRKLNSKIDF